MKNPIAIKKKTGQSIIRNKDHLERGAQDETMIELYRPDVPKEVGVRQPNAGLQLQYVSWPDRQRKPTIKVNPVANHVVDHQPEEAAKHQQIKIGTGMDVSE